MPRRPKEAAARPRTVLIPPDEHCWIESDAYDRSEFAALVADAPSLAKVAEDGGTLVPYFRALLEDVFCLLFKLEPHLRPAEAVAPAAALNRTLLEAFHGHPLLEHLRERTPLDETQAGLGTLLIAEQVLAMLREETLLPRGDLLDLWDLERRDAELRRRGEELADVERLAEEGDAAARRVRDDAAHAARVAEARLRQKGQQVAERLREMPARARAALPVAAAGLARQLAEAGQESESWGTGLGAGGRTSPGRKIELGREEVFEVRLGSDLERLLPPELLALHHPLLRRDFARRLVEGRLLSYSLRGADQRGRGPMIVCLDGSGSMAGDKEIWSKSVALTLLEIARRQRRLFRFICFSSADTPLFTLDLNPRERHDVQEDRALDVAEYFPGGGTDFETPLSAALACLGAARYRRGDVVLITDGECRVSPEWRERFQAEKKRLQFSLYSVLIDVGPSSVEVLRQLSDRVTAVSTLTDDAARDLFLRL